jgi:hypothetical protein
MVLSVREKVNKVMEEARTAKLVGAGLEARVRHHHHHTIS